MEREHAEYCRGFIECEVRTLVMSAAVRKPGTTYHMPLSRRGYKGDRASGYLSSIASLNDDYDDNVARAFC